MDRVGRQDREKRKPKSSEKSKANARLRAVFMTPKCRLQESKYFWWPDGTVILQAETTLFRVSAGLLCQRSRVFNTILSRRPSFFKKSIPHVEMEGCSATDVHHFLKGIHITSINYDDLKDLVDMSPDEIAGVLRVSTKYKADSLRSKALYIMRRWFPITSQCYWERNDPRDPPLKHAQLSSSDVIFLINVSRELDLRDTFVFSLLSCCYAELHEIQDGVKRGGHHIELSPEDKSSVIAGRQILMDHARAHVYHDIIAMDSTATPAELPACGKRTCAEALIHSRAALVEAKWINPFDDPVNVLTHLPCRECCEQLEVRTYEGVVGELWDGIEAVFDLSSEVDWGRPDEGGGR